MRISEYPPEELQEWLDLPATNGFIEEIEVLIKSMQEQYQTFRNDDEGLHRHQGKELGAWEVIKLLESLREGL